VGFVLLAAAGFGWTGRTWRLVPILTIFALVIVIDLCVRLVPDILTALGLVYAVGLAAIAGQRPLVDAVVGTMIAGGVLLLLALASRGQIGGGDVKLAAVLGAALGWQVALVVVAVAEVAAGIVGLIALAVLRRRPTRLIPDGAVIALFGAVALIVTS
jgi:prepilin signal peptidase PulO-like enzyme (type II secretory pathway)